MAVESVMLSLGTNAPPFALRDVVRGQVYQLDSFANKSGLLVIFLCRHCPYVVHVQDDRAVVEQQGVAGTHVFGQVRVVEADPRLVADLAFGIEHELRARLERDLVALEAADAYLRSLQVDQYADRTAGMP